MIKKTAERTGLALVLAASMLAAACGDEGSAEKAGQKAGQKIDQAAETVRKSAGDFVEQAEKKAREAAEAIRAQSKYCRRPKESRTSPPAR
jgi:hypothetical protein